MTNDEEDYTPRIVVLGAGPIGLEAAIYARYLGYEVAVVERGTVANNVQRWGHVRIVQPIFDESIVARCSCATSPVRGYEVAHRRRAANGNRVR